MNIVMRILAALLVLVAAALGLSVGLLWHLDLNDYKPQIAALLSQQTGLQVELAGALEHHIAHGLQVSAWDLRARYAGRQVLDIERLRARVSLGHLLARRVVIDELEIVVRRLDLVSAPGAMSDRPAGEAAARGPKPRPEVAMPIDGVEIGRLRIEVREGRFQDAASAQDTRIQNLVVSVAPLPLLVAGRPVVGGPAEVMGLAQQGELRADSLSFGALGLRGLDVRFANDHGLVTLQHLAAALQVGSPNTLGSVAARFSAGGQLHLHFDESFLDLPATPWWAIDDILIEPLSLIFDHLSLDTAAGPLRIQNARIESASLPLLAKGATLWERMSGAAAGPPSAPALRATLSGDALSYNTLRLEDYAAALDLQQGALRLTLDKGRLGVRARDSLDPIGELTGVLGPGTRLTLSLAAAQAATPTAPLSPLRQAVLEHLDLDLDSAWLRVGRRNVTLRKARLAADALPLVVDGHPIGRTAMAQEDGPLTRFGTRLELQAESLQWTSGYLGGFALAASWADGGIQLELGRGSLSLEQFTAGSFVRSLALDLDGNADLRASGWSRAGGLPERVLLARLALTARQVKLVSRDGDYGLASGQLEVSDLPLVRNGEPSDPSIPALLLGTAPDIPRLQLSARNLTYGGRSIESVDLAMDDRDDTLYFKRLEAQLADTRLSGTGDLRLGGDPPPWHLRLTSPGVAVAPLLAFFHSPHNAKGHLTLDLDLQGTGVSADQLLSHLDGTLRMDGKDLEILDTDLDAVLTHMENSQGVGLLDIGAYALLGPAGVLLTKGTEYSALLGSVIQRGKSRVTAMHSALRIESGVVHTEDVAIATPKHRLAVKGTLDLRDQGRAALQIATVDAQGCANYVETLAGSGRSPQVNHAGMVINSVLNPVNSVLDTVVRTLTGGCSKPFYQGQVAAP